MLGFPSAKKRRLIGVPIKRIIKNVIDHLDLLKNHITVNRRLMKNRIG
jgi:hypothetical protein